MNEEWFTLENIEPIETEETLYCLGVESETKQFLIGNMGVPTHNTDEGKADDALKGEASMIIGSIARLGRAAGVHLVIATQRPDAKIIAGETKANLGVRINCGTTNSMTSAMILESSEGTRVKSQPRGRLYLQIYGKGDHGQGFFADPNWIDEYLKGQGLNPDGTPINGKKRSRLANVADMSQFEGTTLDEREGIDNSAIIEQIRQEESDEDFDSTVTNSSDDDFDVEEFMSDDSSDEEEDNAPEDDGSRPKLSGGKTDLSKWERPEDSWDKDLEGLIDENFN